MRAQAIRSSRVVATPTVPVADISDAPPPVTVLRRLAAALHYRDFRVLWMGAFTSSIGTWMQKVAQNWLVLTIAGVGVGLLPRARYVSRRSADPALHAHRRRRRRSPRPAPAPADVAVRPDGDGIHAGRARLLGCRPHLARADAVGHHGDGAGVRRSGAPVAHAVAHRQTAPAERDRAQLDSIQPRRA